MIISKIHISQNSSLDVLLEKKSMKLLLTLIKSSNLFFSKIILFNFIYPITSPLIFIGKYSVDKPQGYINVRNKSFLFASEQKLK
jgi:hypothetical protein